MAELWGPQEADGLCVMCQAHERYQRDQDLHDAWDEEDDALDEWRERYEG